MTLSLPDSAETQSLVEEWGPLPIRDWILRTWKGNGRVEEVSCDDPERQLFLDRAKQAFEDRDIPAKRIRTWLNVMLPDEQLGFDVGYPHVHQNNKATTLVHYVDAGDNPPGLDIIRGEDVEKLIPQTGQTIFIPNGVWHGVYRNNGSRPRVAMIATAFP